MDPSGQLPPPGQLTERPGQRAGLGGVHKSPSGEQRKDSPPGNDRRAAGRNAVTREPRPSTSRGWPSRQERVRPTLVRELGKWGMTVTRATPSALVQRNGHWAFTPETRVRTPYALRLSSWSRGDLAAFSLRRTRVRIPQRTRSPARHDVHPRSGTVAPIRQAPGGWSTPATWRWTPPYSGLVGGRQPRGEPAPVRTESAPRRHLDARGSLKRGGNGSWTPRLARGGRRANPATAGPGAGEADRERGKGRNGSSRPSPGRQRFDSAPPHVSSDQDKTPAQIRAEARKILAEIKAERQRDAILKDAQNRDEQGKQED